MIFYNRRSWYLPLYLIAPSSASSSFSLIVIQCFFITIIKIAIFFQDSGRCKSIRAIISFKICFAILEMGIPLFNFKLSKLLLVHQKLFESSLLALLACLQVSGIIYYRFSALIFCSVSKTQQTQLMEYFKAAV